MTAHQLAALAVVAVPLLVIFGGISVFAWRAFIALLLFALAVHYPGVAILLIAIVLLWRLAWDFLVGFFIALGAGFGARISGAFNSAERAETLREKWIREDRRIRGE